MKRKAQLVKCLNCGEEFVARDLSKDELGWHTTCPKCKGSFDVDPEPQMWRLTDTDDYGIGRVCGYYAKETEISETACYGCIYRARCNADIFSRLAQYEDTGLLPEEILELKEKANGRQ